MTDVLTVPTPARTLLRRFLRVAIEGQDEVTTSDLIDRALARFEDDPEFMRAAVRELITLLIPQLVQEHMHRRRDQYVTTATGAITRGRLEATASERLSKVFENFNGQYKVITEMTKPELLEAAAARENRAAGELRWASFERDVAALMPDSSVTVGECLTSSQLGGLLAKHFPRADV